MTILYAAGEPADLSSTWTPTEIGTRLISTSSTFKESISRISFGSTSGTVLYAPLENTTSSFWLHFSQYPRTSSTSPAHTGLDIGVYDASNNLITGLGSSSTTYTAQSVFHANSGNLWTPGSGALRSIDVNVFMDAASGFIRWYIDGSAVYEFLGDTRGAVGDATKVGFGRTAGNSDTNKVGFLSQIIVSTQPTIGAKLYTVAPVAAGADSQWTGAVTDVNHIGLDDTTFVSTDTVGNKQSFTITPPASLPTGLQIAAIRTSYRASRDASSAVNNLQPYFKIGGTDYNAGSPFALSTVTSSGSVIVETNPATSLPWQLADLTGFETGFEAQA